jgi:glucose-6-phosphate-specific signal transduction histidine kinase
MQLVKFQSEVQLVASDMHDDETQNITSIQHNQSQLSRAVVMARNKK